MEGGVLFVVFSVKAKTEENVVGWAQLLWG